MNSLVAMTQRGLKRAGRILLCASAILGGAILAHVTTPSSRRVERAIAAATRHVAPNTPTQSAGDAPPFDDDAHVVRIHDPVSFERDSFGENFRDGVTITGATEHRFILFTFDDGPDYRTTPRLLDLLDRNNVKAVFFLAGYRIDGNYPVAERQAAIAREMVRRGHIVGNHTHNHLNLPSLSTEEAIVQIEAAEAAIVRATGRRPWLLRPPYGAHSERIDHLVQERGYTTMLWNIGTGDYQVRTPEDVLNIWRRAYDIRLRQEGQRGGIILLHDTHAWSVEAFQLIYNDIMRRNCELLAAGEELFDVVDDPSVFFAPRAGNNTAVAEAAPAMHEPPPEVVESRQEILREQAQTRCGALALR